MSTPLPTFQQVDELPATATRAVPAEYIDLNGHMNITRYLEIGGRAMWFRCGADLGMDDDYIGTRGFSTFTAEHHLSYFAEMLEGEEYSTHVRVIERSDKVLHAMALILNRTRQQLACTMETTLVHMDMTKRAPTPFPDDVAALIDTALKTDDLAWPAPVCGSMGVRRRS